MPKNSGRGTEKLDGAAKDQRSRDLEMFSRAVSLFNAGKFDEAKNLFLKLAANADASLGDAARSRALICERRMET
jgi:hypothetical protein